MASKKRRPGPGDENRHRRQKLVTSFANAWQGIVVCFVEERNIKIHFMVAVLVMIFGFILQISKTEWCLCFVLFGLIMGLELVNTAVESVVDLVTEEWRPLGSSGWRHYLLPEAVRPGPGTFLRIVLVNTYRRYRQWIRCLETESRNSF